MNRLNNLVSELSKTKVVLTYFGAFLLVLIFTNVVFKPSFTYLTQTFNYSPRSAYDLLSTIGEEGRKTHLLVFILDVIMVALYTAFLVGANYATFHKWVKNCSLISIITFLPVILAGVQILEIVGLIGLITHYPTELFALARVTNILTILKSILTVVCFILPIIGLGVTIILKRFKKVIINEKQSTN